MATATDRFHRRKLLNCDRPSQTIVNCDKRHGVGAGVHSVADGQLSGQSLTLIHRICPSPVANRRRCLFCSSQLFKTSVAEL
ncbi:hypothetical protein COLO4_24500 [Corchorus olitorius]|uniref:Uncharacterized protein n=1 Tax=Corchorus olitorius TaxID=93759 RepID=A0A1R3I9H7_9ROSI|nr:hypothetical protein COLO4_24500 [Corchorus olitorius]